MQPIVTPAVMALRTFSTRISRSTAVRETLPRSAPADQASAAGAIAQHELLDLPGGGLRQRAEHHALRHLEAGQMVAAPPDDARLVRAALGPGLERDEGAGRL